MQNDYCVFADIVISLTAPKPRHIYEHLSNYKASEIKIDMKISLLRHFKSFLSLDTKAIHEVLKHSSEIIPA